MKKLIVSALMALSCGVLFAEDMYLCWMIDTGATFDVAPGDLSGYTAKITSDGQNYLNLYYEQDGALISLGGVSTVATEVRGLDTLAGITGSESSFFVELYNAAGVKMYTSEILRDIEAYRSKMEGMARPADTYGFNTFKAAAVPEPTSGLLLLLGVAGLALRRKNKKA